MGIMAFEVDDNVVHKFMCGSCMNFALALRQKFGYELGYVHMGTFDDESEKGFHVVGLVDGKAVDVKGIRLIEAVLKEYSGWGDMKMTQIAEHDLRIRCDRESDMAQLMPIHIPDINHATEIINHNPGMFG